MRRELDSVVDAGGLELEINTAPGRRSVGGIVRASELYELKNGAPIVVGSRFTFARL
jgi:hypothetical protein